MSNLKLEWSHRSAPNNQCVAHTPFGKFLIICCLQDEPARFVVVEHPGDSDIGWPDSFRTLEEAKLACEKSFVKRLAESRDLMGLCSVLVEEEDDVKIFKSDVKLARLKRKIQKRDQRISRLEKQLAEVQSGLIKRISDYQYIQKDLSKEVTRSVLDALCNVRMIPVFPIHGEKHIVEVTTKKAD